MSYDFEGEQDYRDLKADAAEKTFVEKPVVKATAFKEEQFAYWGGFLEYVKDDGEKVVVARFKYAAVSSWKTFKNFLKKKFTVEEYFGRLEKGETPLKVVKSKGYILSHIKKFLRQGENVWKGEQDG